MPAASASHCSCCLQRRKLISFPTAQCNRHWRLYTRSHIPGQRVVLLRTGGHTSYGITCCAKPSATRTKASQADAQRLAQQLPNSKEQSIEQAAQALKSQLAAAVPKSKGFKSVGTSKLTVDIPVADSSNAAVSELVSNLVQALPKSCTDQLTVIFANDKAAQHVADTAKLKLRTLSLGDAFLERLSGVLLIVGVKQNQIEKVEVLLSQWKGHAAVLLNAEWDYASIPTQHRAFTNSFESIYSFLPLDIKGFVFKTPAVIYKSVTKGSPGSSPWYLFVQEGKGHKCIARQQQRLTPENLELAYYNYKAAESPITKGVKLFKSILPQK